MMDENQIIATISEKTQMPADQIKEMIDAKEVEFGGLVSRIGAAFIVGKELGIEMMQPIDKTLKIKNIVPGMRNVTFMGKIAQISPIRNFETEDGKGQVLNILLGDDTGFIRFSLWDEKAVQAVEELNSGQVWQIIGGYTKTDPAGKPELRLGKWGNMKKSDVDIKMISSPHKQALEYKEAKIDSLEEDDFVVVKAWLLQLNTRQPLYYFCSVCKARLENEASTCNLHKDARADAVLIVSGVLDDGYGSVGAVFFRNAAESLLELDTKKIAEKIKEVGDKNFFESLSVTGNLYEMFGVVRKNKLTNRLEITVHKLKKVQAEKEIASALQTQKDD